MDNEVQKIMIRFEKMCTPDCGMYLHFFHIISFN
jgi:hypothetical protein